MLLPRTLWRVVESTTVKRSVTTAAAPLRKPYVRKPAPPRPTVRAPASASSSSTAAASSTVAPSTPKVVEVAASKPLPNWGTSADIYSDEHGVDDLLPELPPIVSPPSSFTPSIPASNFSSPPTSSSTYPSISNTFPSAPMTPVESAPVARISHQVPLSVPAAQKEIDWTTSFHGISSQPFSEKAAALLMRPLEVHEIEIKPDGLLYLPEILYRRVLNQAFGPGGWGMVPRGEMTVLKMMVSREWGLVAGGRLVSVSRGEQTYFDASGLPTATEGCKSNALMRCCKDLGIASELWDPAFIRVFKASHCVEAWTEHASTKKKARRWRKKGNKFEYPLVESKVIYLHDD